MATTMKLIEKVVLGSDTASVTIGSGGTIPQNYTDLLLVISSRQSDNATYAYGFVRINGDIGSNYTVRYIQGTGSSAVSSSATQSGLSFITSANTATASTFGSAEFYFPNYAGSTNKSVSSTALNENNGSEAYIMANAYLWSSTAAITSLTLLPAASTNFKSGSSFFLFGITKA